jgi:hypothetical protein
MVRFAFYAVVVASLLGGSARGQIPGHGLKTCTWWDSTKFYNCVGDSLSAVPSDIPAGTLTLGMSDNPALAAIAPATVFNHLTALKILDASSNALAPSVPAAAFALTAALESLDLHGNALTTLLPATFDALASLEYLYLQRNQIAALPAGIFDKLTSLKELDLSYNRLGALPAGAFDKLLKLEVLNLRGNLLTAIAPVPVPTFGAALALHTLDLYDNAIPAFDTRAWDALAHLQFLTLSGQRAGATRVEVIEEDLYSCDGRPGLSRAIHFGPYQGESEWLQKCNASSCVGHCVLPGMGPEKKCGVCCDAGPNPLPGTPCYAGHVHNCSICARDPQAWP